MARKPRVQIVGAKKLRKELKRAGFDMRNLREPHMESARVVAYAGKPDTPRDTGALAATVRPAGTQTMGIVRAGKASVPYANPIHWGWPDRNITAQPWLSEAAERTEPTWLQIFLDYLNEVLSRVEGAQR